MVMVLLATGSPRSQIILQKFGQWVGVVLLVVVAPCVGLEVIICNR
jgi:hypothetical protein